MERKPNQVRHEQNKSLLHGVYYEGVYWNHGIPQRGEVKLPPTPASQPEAEVILFNGVPVSDNPKQDYYSLAKAMGQPVPVYNGKFLDQR